jgi:hypothetical protein
MDSNITEHLILKFPSAVRDSVELKSGSFGVSAILKWSKFHPDDIGYLGHKRN